MNTPSKAMPDSPAQANVIAAAEISPTRLFYWLVRRELWENRSIYLAPLAAAAVALFGFLISLLRLLRKIHGVSALDATQQHTALEVPYEIVAGVIMVTAFVVGVFYSIDALHGERRDRSILFWKSLPVSDLMTVLSKLSIPLVLIPLLAFVITIVTQLIMLLLSSALLLASGVSVGPLWTHASFLHVSLMLLYHIVTVHGLWYAPLYGWLLLVSAWARRAPFLWAFLPPLAIYAIEKIAFNSSYFLAMLQDRLMGPGNPEAAGSSLMDTMAALTPAKFFSTPGLWIGFAIAAVFLAGAVRLRRSQGPI